MARCTGVSIATVSRALSGTGYVAQETRGHILRVADEMGYRPRSQPAPVYTPLSRDLVGMIVPDLTNPFFAEAVRGAQDELARRGCHLLVCDSRETPQREIALLHTLHKQKVGGVLIAPALEAIDYNIEYLHALAAKGMPITLLDRDLEGAEFDGVFVDDRKSARDAVRLLIEQGHRHIALLAGVPSSQTGEARRRGYEDALREAGYPLREEYVLRGDFRMQQALDAVRGFLPRAPKVTAVFSSNNLMTLGCLKALREVGLRVPGDVALVGFDDMSLFEPFGHNITVLSRPVEQMGAEAAAILIQRMEHRRTRGAPTKRITLRCTLEKRGSEAFPEGRRRE